MPLLQTTVILVVGVVSVCSMPEGRSPDRRKRSEVQGPRSRAESPDRVCNAERPSNDSCAEGKKREFWYFKDGCQKTFGCINHEGNSFGSYKFCYRFCVRKVSGRNRFSQEGSTNNGARSDNSEDNVSPSRAKNNGDRKRTRGNVDRHELPDYSGPNEPEDDDDVSQDRDNVSSQFPENNVSQYESQYNLDQVNRGQPEDIVDSGKPHVRVDLQRPKSRDNGPRSRDNTRANVQGSMDRRRPSVLQTDEQDLRPDSPQDNEHRNAPENNGRDESLHLQSRDNKRPSVLKTNQIPEEHNCWGSRLLDEVGCEDCQCIRGRWVCSQRTDCEVKEKWPTLDDEPEKFKAMDPDEHTEEEVEEKKMEEVEKEKDLEREMVKISKSGEDDENDKEEADNIEEDDRKQESDNKEEVNNKEEDGNKKETDHNEEDEHKGETDHNEEGDQIEGGDQIVGGGADDNEEGNKEGDHLGEGNNQEGGKEREEDVQNANKESEKSFDTKHLKEYELVTENTDFDNAPWDVTVEVAEEREKEADVRAEQDRKVDSEIRDKQSADNRVEHERKNERKRNTVEAIAVMNGSSGEGNASVPETITPATTPKKTLSKLDLELTENEAFIPPPPPDSNEASDQTNGQSPGLNETSALSEPNVQVRTKMIPEEQDAINTNSALIGSSQNIPQDASENINVPEQNGTELEALKSKLKTLQEKVTSFKQPVSN